MGTLNPRITVTLQPQVHAVLKRLSELTKNSQSALVGELLSESLPVFERMVEVLAAAEQLRLKGLQAGDEVKVALAKAQGRMETQLGLAMDDWDTGNRALLDAAEKVRRRASASAAAQARAVAETPPSNRGVRSAPRKAQKASKEGGQ